MTADEIARLRGLLAAATPGPADEATYDCLNALPGLLDEVERLARLHSEAEAQIECRNELRAQAAEARAEVERLKAALEETGVIAKRDKAIEHTIEETRNRLADWMRHKARTMVRDIRPADAHEAEMCIAVSDIVAEIAWVIESHRDLTEDTSPCGGTGCRVCKRGPDAPR